jgi:hypothetical protein
MKLVPAVPVPAAARSVPALTRAARLIPARLRHGRPGRLAARTAGTFALAEAAFHSGAGPAAIAGTLAGIITWLGFAARPDVAPPPGR